MQEAGLMTQKVKASVAIPDNLGPIKNKTITHIVEKYNYFLQLSSNFQEDAVAMYHTYTHMHK